mgnify:CR=1 FL=1
MINTVYSADEGRYSSGMQYRRSGRSGIMLPEISLGLWQNFGDTSPLSRSREMILHAFDKGICHFDLANNYGPSFLYSWDAFGERCHIIVIPLRNHIRKSNERSRPDTLWNVRKNLLIIFIIIFLMHIWLSSP